MVEAASRLGLSLAKGVLVEIGTEYISNQLRNMPMISTKFGDVKVVFKMITKLYEVPSYDIGNTEIQRVLENLHSSSSDGQFELNDIFFNYNCEWDFDEEYLYDATGNMGSGIAYGPWMSDLKIDGGAGILSWVNTDIEVAARLVQGFRLSIYPITKKMDLADVLISGYKLLDSIEAYIKRNSTLKINYKVIAIAIIANEQTNSRLLSKLKKKIDNEDLLSGIKLNIRSKQSTQLIIYPRDGFAINAIIDAIKPWWSL